MDLKIQKIILWPKNEANVRREISFKCKGVEVISGWSQKGKSALIQIVDYCLGSEKCAIPIGRVRDTVEWFGLVLVLPGKKIVVGRRNPGNQSTSAEMLWLEGRSVRIPNDPNKLASRDSIVDRLNELASLPSAGPSDSDSSSFDGPPSFRDMAAFNFQPQHIIANPYTLFFKADTSVHREKLIRSVFPYVLGAVDAQTLSDQALHRRLEQELRIKRELLDQQERAAAMWQGRLANFATTMQRYGLVEAAIEINNEIPVEQLVGILRPVPLRWKEDTQFKEIDGMAKQVRRQVLALQVEETRLNREIGDAERKIKKMSRLQAASDDYRNALTIQQERLEPSLWLAKRLDASEDCPLCGSKNAGAAKVRQLVAIAKEVGEAMHASKPVDETLTTEIRRLEELVLEKQKQLSSVEVRLEDWEHKNEALKESRSRREAVSDLVGQLKAVLETIDAASGSGKLKKEVTTLQKDADLISKKVNFSAIRQRTDTALSKISVLIGHYARILKVEHHEQRWMLDDRNLTLSTKGEAKTDFLWEIGSAANWMGYHVATLLALHEHFRSVPHNPVPKFLIIDQPSQAFFPEGLLAARKTKSAKKISDDLQRLQRLFQALSEAIVRTQAGLQIILLEHAEPDTWRGIPNFSMPDGEWRGDEALIPSNWK